MRHLRDREPGESLGHIGDSAEMLRPRDLSAFGIDNEIAERVLSREEETPLAQPEAPDFAPESELEQPAAKKQELGAEIKTLSKLATEQIDRMEQASTRLTLLEQIRLHAETMVYQRADREIRLRAEIDALRRTEAAQLKRIEEAEAEAQTRQRAAAVALKLAEEAARRLTEEEEQRIEHLETIRRRAEASSHERAEKERLLNSQLLAFGEAAAEQLKRIERAEAELRGAAKKALQFDEDARQKSEQDASQLTETAAPRQTAAERFHSAEAQAGEKVHEEGHTIAPLELIREIGNEENQQRSKVVTDRNDDTQPLTSNFPVSTSNAGKTDAWWVSQLSNQGDPSAEEEIQFASNEELASSVVDPLKTSEQTSTEDSARPLEPVRSKGNIELTSRETSIVSSLAERIRTGDPAERADALRQVAQVNADDAFSLITSLFDDNSAEVRNAAARALYELKPNRADTFTRALREASPEGRRQITKALVGSGLAAEAIDNLGSESQEKTYDAFSMLCLMVKAGEFQSILHTIEMHPNTKVKLSVIKLLTFCNLPEIIPAFRNLAVRGSLPTEIRSALLASIYELKTKPRENSPSAA